MNASPFLLYQNSVSKIKKSKLFITPMRDSLKRMEYL
jgi:hypothetical protein